MRQLCGIDLAAQTIEYESKKSYPGRPQDVYKRQVVTAASVFLGLTTTSIGDMGNMTAALPDVHLPTLLLSLETWKIVLPYSISLAFVGLIETLLTQQEMCIRDSFSMLAI